MLLFNKTIGHTTLQMSILIAIRWYLVKKLTREGRSPAWPWLGKLLTCTLWTYTSHIHKFLDLRDKSFQETICECGTVGRQDLIFPENEKKHLDKNNTHYSLGQN